MGRNLSVLDNKETLTQFLRDSKEQKGSSQHRRNYFLTKGRFINLTVATALDKSINCKNTEINKVVRGLRYCSKLNMIKSDFTGEIENLKSTARCKSPHCAICRRARSGRLAARLMAAILDDENADLFHYNQFYFLTLTMKHDKDTRNYNYLKEFKEASKKLTRSKIYKKHFKGAITSIENVIGKDYHIHSHSLLVGDIQGKVNELQQELSKKWLKLTGDSFMLSLDLIKTNNLHKSIIEVVKYSTKIMKLKELEGERLELLANWIIDTKGQNFVNVSGYFRGLELTSNKSKYDTVYEPPVLDKSDICVLGRTSKQKFNFNPNRTYAKKGKLARDEFLYLKGVDKEGIIINGDTSLIVMGLLNDTNGANDMKAIKDSLQDINDFTFELGYEKEPF